MGQDEKRFCDPNGTGSRNIEDVKIAIDLYKHQDNLYWGNFRFLFLIQAGTISVSIAFFRFDNGIGIPIFFLCIGLLLTIFFFFICDKLRKDRDERFKIIFTYFDSSCELGRFTSGPMRVRTFRIVQFTYFVPAIIDIILILYYIYTG